MYCMYCGKQMKDDMMFCPYCGKQMPTEKPVEKKGPELSEPEPLTGYHITVVRIKKMMYPFNSIQITVDGKKRYEVKNGESVGFDLPPGMHQLVFSVFSMPRKVTVPLDVSRNRSLTCYINAANGLVNPLLTKPVVVIDENGTRY